MLTDLQIVGDRCIGGSRLKPYLNQGVQYHYVKNASIGRDEVLGIDKKTVVIRVAVDTCE